MLHFKNKIDKSGITEKLVQDIITAHQTDHERMKKLYERYKAEAEGPKIFKRSAAPFDGFGKSNSVKRLDDKVNNRLNNAYDVDIVDTKIGYMFGHPISYNVDQKDAGLKKEIEDFLLRNNAEDADAECGKMAAICGYSSRLAYIDMQARERIKNLDPWETVLLGEEIQEPDYSLRYFKVGKVNHAEFYDDLYIYYFSQESGGQYVLDDIQPHMFDFNPLFGIANNKELKADAEKVLALIDAYDRTLSDASNEIEQYRLAYLILKGMGADDDTLDKLKQTGMFELFGENDDVKYLTKDINDQMIENHLDRLEENILKFSKSVNFSDESFGGNITGIAMRFKLLALENKCITMERKFVSALRYQFKVIFSAWKKRKGFNEEDYLKVFFGFKRNLPANILDEAQSTQALKGHVSERTRLSLLSFVDDVEYEIKEMEEDALRLGEVLPDLNEDEEGFDSKEESGEIPQGKGDSEYLCPECGGGGKITSLATSDQIQCPSCKGTGVRKK
ncbi:phage portal protein [Planococcus sp. ANT_H30]|uniref:phage portal protein n=1 Tax=Planococcus sp. ANT_H30 TaxID=2597347 RepID=UPI0011EEE2C0|nr:phage portal protein [Planococcus sp. ANT_H30]KAA0956643.1 phage portal protein [Planococcus sp. ANT_H30]